MEWVQIPTSFQQSMVSRSMPNKDRLQILRHSRNHFFDAESSTSTHHQIFLSFLLSIFHPLSSFQNLHSSSNLAMLWFLVFQPLPLLALATAWILISNIFQTPSKSLGHLAFKIAAKFILWQLLIITFSVIVPMLFDVTYRMGIGTIEYQNRVHRRMLDRLIELRGL